MTEMITGVDLIQEQIRVAMGETLRLLPGGHRPQGAFLLPALPPPVLFYTSPSSFARHKHQAWLVGALTLPPADGASGTSSTPWVNAHYGRVRVHDQFCHATRLRCLMFWLQGHAIECPH